MVCSCGCSPTSSSRFCRRSSSTSISSSSSKLSTSSPCTLRKSALVSESLSSSMSCLHCWCWTDVPVCVFFVSELLQNGELPAKERAHGTSNATRRISRCARRQARGAARFSRGLPARVRAVRALLHLLEGDKGCDLPERGARRARHRGAALRLHGLGRQRGRVRQYEFLFQRRRPRRR